MPALLPGQTIEALATVESAVAEQTLVTVPSVDTGTVEITTITFPTGSAAAQGDYFTFENQAGDDFAVWLDIDADGTTPSGGGFTGATTKIEADIETADSATVVAATVVAAIASAFTDVTILDNSDGTVLYTQDLMGTTVDPVPHNTGDTGAGSITVSVDTAGVASTLLDTFFTISTTAGNFHVWSNINGEGTDPNPGSSTALESTYAIGASVPTIHTAHAAAIDGNGGFAAEVENSKIRVRNAATGNAVDAVDGDAGVTVETLRQGRAAGVTPGGNYASDNPQPSNISLPT